MERLLGLSILQKHPLGRLRGRLALGNWRPFTHGRFLLHPRSRFVRGPGSQLHIEKDFRFGYPSPQQRARMFMHRGELHLGKNATLTIGGAVEILPGTSLILADNARFTIGDGSTFAGDSYFVVTGESRIGTGCRFSWGVTFLDSDLHELRDAAGTVKNAAAPITIGNDVWVGHGASILKGVKLGDRCVVGAKAVVTRSFPARSIIAGVPAKKIGETDGSWSKGMHFE